MKVIHLKEFLDEVSDEDDCEFRIQIEGVDHVIQSVDYESNLFHENEKQNSVFYIRLYPKRQ